MRDAIRFRGARAFQGSRERAAGAWTTGTSTAKTEPRPTRERDAIGPFKQKEKALDDGKPESKPLCALARMVIQLMKLFEDRVEFGFRNPCAGVPDFDA